MTLGERTCGKVTLFKSKNITTTSNIFAEHCVGVNQLSNFIIKQFFGIFSVQKYDLGTI